MATRSTRNLVRTNIVKQTLLLLAFASSLFASENDIKFMQENATGGFVEKTLPADASVFKSELDIIAADITDATPDGRALITAADANPFTDAEQSKLASALTNEEQTIAGIQTFTDPIEALAGVNLRNDSNLTLYGGDIFLDQGGRIAIGTKSFNLDGAGEMQLNSHLEFHSMTDAIDPDDTVVVGYPGSSATGRGPGIKMELATGSYWHAINLGDDFVVRNSGGEAMRADAASRVATFPGGYGTTARPTDPPDPPEGQHVIWQSTGAGHGAAGDVIIKITNGGTTKTHTLVDFSDITDEQP